MDSVSSMFTFIKVVDTGSFSGAAKYMKVPASTVSRRISRLEERLGVQLLLRTTRKLALTDAGSIYYERCKQIVEEIEDAEQTISSMSSSPKGVLRITGPVDFNELLGTIVADFSKAYPELCLEIYLTNRNVDLIEEGFDLALRGGEPKDSSMIARKLSSDIVTLVGSPAYFEQYGRPQTLEDLEDHECLLYEVNGKLLHWRTKSGRILHLKPKLICNDFLLLRNAALAGMGLVCLPGIANLQEIENGLLIPVLQEYFGQFSSFYVLYPVKRHLPLKTRVFLDYITKFFNESNP